MLLLLLLLLVGSREWFWQWLVVPPQPPATIAYGVTFSPAMATELGLDWRQAYAEILGLGFQHVRLPIRWDQVESQPGVFNWAWLDWQLAEAANADVRVLLTVGHRAPRYPECFAPAWSHELGEAEFKQHLFRFIQAAVQRYRYHPALDAWQIENEPLAKIAGQPWGLACREVTAYVAEEVRLVRTLDQGQHPTVVSYANAPWMATQFHQTLDFGSDVIAVTVFNKLFFRSPLFSGYVEMFRLGPFAPFTLAYQHRVALRQHRLLWVAELQAEPWGPSPTGIRDESPEESYKTINPQRLTQTWTVAVRAGIPRIYFWGAEWWLFQRDYRGDSTMLETVQQLMATPPQRA